MRVFCGPQDRTGAPGGRVRRSSLWVSAAAALAAPLLTLSAPAAHAATQPFKVVFQANDNVLAGYSSSGSNFSTTLGMAPGTNPSLAQLADGTYEAAFEANNDNLALNHLGGGTLNTTLGMSPGTSPAIAALPGGGWITAFRDNAGTLYLYDSKGAKTNTTLAVAPGTSPAIATQSDGSYRVVFQNTSHQLAGYNSTGSTYTTTVGMNPATSPALAAKPDGSYEAAAQANNNDLTTMHIGAGYTVNTTTLGMDPAAGPSLAVQADGSFKAIFQANNHTLTGYNSSGSNFSTTLGMTPGTNPTITALADGTYEAAFEANNDNLALTHIGGSTLTTTLGMNQGTSPSLATPAPTAPPTTAANIASLADANLGKGAGTCSTTNSALNSLGGTAFYSSCTGNGGSAEFWCADFAKWVWFNSGINVSGLTAAAGSFVAQASQNGSTPHSSSSYAPQVGDAVVYDYNSSTGYADHVGLVTAVNSDGSITTANGDWGGINGQGEAAFAESSTVVAVTIPASQKAVGDTPSSTGMTISYYVTPSGLS